MIIPKNIVWWVALILPFAAAAPHSRSMWCIFAAMVAIFLIVAAADAVAGIRRSAVISVSLPEIAHFHFLRQCFMKFRIHNPEKHRYAMFLNPMIPAELGPGQPEINLQIPESEFSEFPIECRPVSRGSFRIERCFFEIESPLKLWSVRRKSELSSEVRVYPDLRRDSKTFASLVLNTGLEGMHLQPTIGQGREFEKLRDYISGDGYDIIAWKATAKKGRPVSKVFQIERTQKIYAVIDISRLSGKKTECGLSSLEYYLNAALLLGLAAERQGDMFGLLAFDDQVCRFIRASNGRSHYLRCRDSIYSLKTEVKSPGFDNILTFIRLNIRSRAIIFFLTDLSEPGIAESFLSGIKVVNRQHLCLVNSMKDSGYEPLFGGSPAMDADDLAAKLAGHICWAELMGVRRKLARFGVHFSISDFNSFNIDLISDYVNVKKRQLV